MKDTLRKSIIAFVLSGFGFTGAAQVNEQLWFEYMLNYSFANSFNLENSFQYSTVMNAPKWRAFDYMATLEYSVTQHIDLIAYTGLSYTEQLDSYNTFEVRPGLGTRVYLTPANRVQVRVLLRVDQRNFENLEDNTWTQSYRPRIRFESLIPINQDSYYKDNMWYGIADVEWLFVQTDLKERFANRFRMRTGLGYRLNGRLRFEFIYMLQQSRNGIDQQFESTDNIFRFRVKHYLRKAKSSGETGVGN